MKSLLLSALMILLACVAPYSSMSQPTVPVAVNIPPLIDSIASSLNRHYIFPEDAYRMSAYLHDRLRGKGYDALANRPKDLVKQLQADLNTVLYDPHLFLEYNPAFATMTPESPASAEEEMKQAKKYFHIL